MQTRALKTLLEIARRGSFASAASASNMTLSAVSMQMKSLETELGATLFDRSFRPPQLTSIGRSVCDHAEGVMEAEAALIDACRPTDRLIGRFRVGFVATASVRLLPGFLKAARTRAPEAEFDLETGLSDALEARVLAGQLDAAVVTASETSDLGLNYQLLRKERLTFIAPKAHANLSLDMLFRQLPFFYFNPQSGIGKLIADYVRPLNRHATKGLVLDSVEAILECVNKGIGFTLLPEPDVLRYASDHAAILETGEQAMSRDLVLATSTKASMKVQAKRLADLFAG